MKLAFSIWTALCSSVILVMFFAAPAWDTEADGYPAFSGLSVFVAFSAMAALAWIAGSVVLLVIRRAKRGRWLA